ncbi:MAG: TolC family protein [bacterium]|jgi:outer membrane protein TolC|nr:TolC family protein [bacterium]
MSSRSVFSILLVLLGLQAGRLPAEEQETHPPPAGLLDLEEALARALAGHREVEGARLALLESRLAREAARLRLTPRLTLTLRAPSIIDSRNETWTAQGDSLRLVWVDWNQRRESGGLALNQELPLGTRLGLSADTWHRRSDTGSFDEEYGGAWSARVRQSLLPRSLLLGDLVESGREAEQAGLEALEQLADFRHRVALAFLALLQRQEGMALARQDLSVSRGNLERAASRFEAGLIAESDYLKVELDDLRLRASFQTDSLATVLAGRDFMRLLGGTEATAPPLDPRLPAAAGPQDRAALAALLAAGNAGLARQRLESLKARREQRRARVDRLPELELDAAWTWREEGGNWLWRPDEPVLDRSISLDLSWPLLAGGERGRALRSAGIHLRRQELRLRELEESLAATLEQFWLRSEELRLQAPLLERQLELAERDAAISRERFAAGQITSQDLIDADRALSRARLQALEMRVAQVRVRLDLERLTGQDREAVRLVLEEQAIGQYPVPSGQWPLTTYH